MVQTTFLEPDFLLVGQVGGDRCVGNPQVFDVDFADDLADLAEDLFATDRSQPETDVDQAQDIQIVQAFDPVAVLVELAGSVNTADHCAHGPFDLFDYPDMGVTAGPTRAQHQCDTFFHHALLSSRSPTMHPRQAAVQSPRP